MNRKFAATAAAIALSTSLVACSNDEAEVNEVEATETNTATVTSATAAGDTATESASASESADASGAAAADGETTEITTQDGEKVVVPAAAANAPEELGLGNWGDPFNVETTDDGATLIEYDAEKNIVYSEETGAVPLVGEIAKTWKKDGGLKNEIGLPLKAEDKRSDDNGWIQEFQNGTIEWLEENGEFGAKIS